MKTSLTLFTVVILLFSVSCGKTDMISYYFPKFLDSLNIEAKILNDTFIFETGYLSVSSEYVIYNGRTDINDKLYHIFDYNGNYIRSFGEMGRGPGEISSNLHTGVIVDDSLYCVFDNALSKMAVFYLRQDSCYEIRADMSVPPVFPWLFMAIDENRHISFTRDIRFILSNNGDTISTYDEYPDLSKNNEKKNIKRGYFVYKSSHTLSREQERFAIATWGGALIQIFSFTNDKITLCNTLRILEPKFAIPASHINHPLPYIKSHDERGLYDLTSNGEYIYVQYLYSNDVTDSDILCFDWKGNPISILKLNGQDIDRFTVSPDNRFAFAFKTIDYVPYLVKFKLKH